MTGYATASGMTTAVPASERGGGFTHTKADCGQTLLRSLHRQCTAGWLREHKCGDWPGGGPNTRPQEQVGDTHRSEPLPGLAVWRCGCRARSATLLAHAQSLTAQVLLLRSRSRPSKWALAVTWKRLERNEGRHRKNETFVAARLLNCRGVQPTPPAFLARACRLFWQGEPEVSVCVPILRGFTIAACACALLEASGRDAAQERWRGQPEEAAWLVPSCFTLHLRPCCALG